MQIKGTLKKLLPQESGEGRNGLWVKQGFVIKFTGGNQTKELYIIAFGNDRVQFLNTLSIGDHVEVEFNLSSKEYNGKYYTQCEMWRIQRG